MRPSPTLLVYATLCMQPHHRRVCAPSKLLGTLAATLLLVACHRPAPMTQPATLAVLTNLEGITEPCGCTSRPLGGIDRIAEVLGGMRQHGAVALVAVGSTFFTEAEPTEAMRRHEQDKAGAIAAILARLAPASVVLGPTDTGPMAPTLTALAQMTRDALHLVAPRHAGDSGAAAPDFPEQQIQLGEVPVALLAAPNLGPKGLVARAQYTEALIAQAQAARAHGAQLVVLLWPHGLEAARASLDDLHDVDIVLTGTASVLVGDADAAQAPELLGTATLLQAGARGERLGLLTLHPAPAAGAAARWRFFDGHKAERQALQQRATRLHDEAARLPESAGRAARIARAQGLEAEAQALPTTAPKGPHVTWRLEDIDQSHAPAPWATDALAAFNRSLCDSAMADTAKRICPAPASPQAAYVGTERCRACHAQAFEVYERTAHSRAWATLTRVGKQCDLSCVGCHVVGFEQPGGFCHLADANKWENVGCESCHGPGAGHIAHPAERAKWGASFVRDTPEATCRGCHNQEHSDQFNFEAYRPQILGPGHGAPAVHAAGHASEN